MREIYLLCAGGVVAGVTEHPSEMCDFVKRCADGRAFRLNVAGEITKTGNGELVFMDNDGDGE